MEVSTASSVKSSLWIIDSGATEHITNDISNSASYKPFHSPQPVRLGDKSSTNSLGVGSVRLISNVGNRKLVLTLKKVIYAPGIRRNLISVGAATNEGCSASFTGGHVQFRGSKNSLLLIGSRVGRLYVANVESANCREISSLNTEDVATDAPDKDDETGTKDSNMKL